MLADLVKNGGVILGLRVYDERWDMSEASTMLQHAVPGDKYWVQVSRGGRYWGTVNTFFTGTLISADD
nr:hypothetical protein BaRGS_003177 [Batillaria attramentaria]